MNRSMRFRDLRDPVLKRRWPRGRQLISSLAFLLAAGLLATLWLVPPRGTPALAAERGDTAAVAEAIEQLPVVGSVLHTGAHPDDENSILLAYLTRSLRLRTAYLSATRGDGGQNLIGTEQYEALGILRTEELLAARRLDGAGQYFAQVYDFGFSKSPEETFQKWGREAVLGDFVRTIRVFRPDIIISRFSGTPSDGHGHHQAAGILTREAFRAAADPNRFPEQLQEGLKPWQAVRLFLNQGARGASAPITISVDGFSPIFGRTYPEIGLEGRSMHRSQGMGGAGGRGVPAVAGFRLEDSRPGLSPEAQGLFDGVDLTLHRFTALADGAPAVARRVEAIQKAIDAARNALSPTEPAKALPALGQGLAELRALREEFARGNASPDVKDQAQFLLNLKEEDFARTIALAGGVTVEALAESAEIIPGSTFTVTISVLSRAGELSPSGEFSLDGPPGWKIDRQAPAAGSPLAAPSSRPATPGEVRFRVTVPADAAVSQPYWLFLPRTRDSFPPFPVPYLGEAYNPPLLRAIAGFTLAADAARPIPITRKSDVVSRTVDRVYGVKDQPLTVVPEIGVWIEPSVAIFPTEPSASPAQQYLLVRVRNNSSAAQKGYVRLRLRVPEGWQATTPSQEFTLASKGDEVAARFQVSAGATASSQFAQAAAEVAGKLFSTGYQIMDYPHIQTRYWFQPARVKLERLDVKVAPGLRVGYVMGSGDEIPEALQQMGVAVEQLTPDDLTFGDLRKYDVIVTGIRAYEVRRDLAANHARLMDFVQGGGLMIVQYSRGGGYSNPLGPYPLNLGSGPRVTVEEAPVEIAEPFHPLFQSPNKITAADFEGWVQERGTYFMESWDPQYKPMLESHDPGEPPLKGGLLLASYGKGLYIYSGYTWFRQLPEGVPGAYRIFANMVSLGKATASRARSEPRP